jgi:hypothetical protein
MFLCAFVVFLGLFVVSLIGLVLLHRHIESRSLEEAIEGPGPFKKNSGKMRSEV